MGDQNTIIRNYRREDVDALIFFGAEAAKEKSLYCATVPHNLIEVIGQPNHNPEKNLFVAEAGGEILGYVDLTPEPEIGRVVLSFLIHPKHGKKGQAEALLERAGNRARDLGVERIQANVSPDNVHAKRLLTKIGFHFIRFFLELSIDLPEIHVSGLNAAESFCRPLKKGEEDELLRLQNRSFAGTWGYNPNTIEDILFHLGFPDRSPEDIIIAGEGDRPIGYCWTLAKAGEKRTETAGKGRIYMLGVDPDYRGKGMGKQVLLAGLSSLKGKGVKVVELTVDSGNLAARALYRSVGFEVQSSSLWYERELGLR